MWPLQFPIIYNMVHTLEQGLERSQHPDEQMKAELRRRMRGAPLIYLKNPRSFYDRGFLLALGKALGAVAVYIHTGKPFAVVIKHRHLPVLMFPPSITMHSIRLLASLLFHGECFLRASDYYKFIGDAQVSN
jgi:hypothetical protein